MNLLNLAVKVGVEDEATSKIEQLSSATIAKASAMGQAMYDATKLVAGKAVDMAKSFTQGAIAGYGQYEQLAGGVEKLFGKAADAVIANSQRAYLVAGMNQNQYLEASTSLAASLISSLGGDAEAAAERADVAMRAIADNADTFGTSVEDVTAVYMSLSKGMYQTLDNLKLGYAGTKSGMEQLIADANAYAESIGETGDMTIDSYADIVRAIDLVQQQQGLAGTTAKEASTTIEGSMRMAKNAWQDFLAAVGSGDVGRIGQTATAIIDSIFGTWNDELGRQEGGLIANVLPVVQNVAKAVIESIPSLASGMARQVAEMVATALGMDVGFDEPLGKLLGRIFRVAKRKVPKMIGDLLGDTAIGKAFGALTENVDLSGFGEAFEKAGKLAGDAWGWVEQNIIPNLPTIAEYLGKAVTFVAELAPDVMGLVETLAPFIGPLVGALAALKGLTVLTSVVGVITTIGGFVGTIGAALSMVQSFSGAIALVATLLGGWIPIVVAVVGAIAGFLLTNEDAREKLGEVWEGIKEAVGNALEGVGDFLSQLPGRFKLFLGYVIKSVVNWARNLVYYAKEAMKGFLDGIKAKWEDVKKWFAGLPQRMKDGIKNAATALVQRGREFLKGLKDGIVAKWGEVKDWLGKVPEKAKTAIGNVVETLRHKGKEFFEGLRKGIVEKWGEVKEWVGKTATRVRDGVGNVASALFQKGKDFFQGLKDGIVEKWGSVWEWLGGLAGRAKEAIGDLGSALWQKGKDLLAGFWNGLKDIWSDISTWLSGKLSWASSQTASYADAAGGGGGASDGGGGGGGDLGGGAYAARSAAGSSQPQVVIYLQYDAGSDATAMVYDMAKMLKMVL